MLYKQPLFALGDETKGPAYLRRAGETLKVLIEDEERGTIKLPPRFGDEAPSDLLPAHWSAFGIPMVLLIGLALGRVATDEEAKIPLFKSMLHLLRDVDLDLPLRETSAKIAKMCSTMSVAASNFVTRGGNQDLHTVGPILDKLATTTSMSNVAAGGQNLNDDLAKLKLHGTLRSLIDRRAGAPQRNFLDRSAPLSNTRSEHWNLIFNFATSSNPAKGIFHGMESLEPLWLTTPMNSYN